MVGMIKAGHYPFYTTDSISIRLRFDAHSIANSTALRPFDDHTSRPDCPISALEALRNALYKFKTYLLTNLLTLRPKHAVRDAATICPCPVTLTFELLTWKVVSESRVTWATCASFSLPRPLCSRLRPDVRVGQTSDRQTSDSIIA